MCKERFYLLDQDHNKRWAGGKEVIRYGNRSRPLSPCLFPHPTQRYMNESKEIPQLSLFFFRFSFFFSSPDRTEIPVFVELASISAGENDMDIDRVSFFRDAMAASAPIVLDLSPTDGFDQFLAALSFIREAIAKDSKLPKKLVSLQVLCPKVTWTLAVRLSCSRVGVW